jgi:hypothetical protein
MRGVKCNILSKKGASYMNDTTTLSYGRQSKEMKRNYVYTFLGHSVYI